MTQLWMKLDGVNILVHCWFMPLSKIIIQIQELGKSLTNSIDAKTQPTYWLQSALKLCLNFELLLWAGCLLFLRPKHRTPMNEQPTPIFIETLGNTTKKSKEISSQMPQRMRSKCASSWGENFYKWMFSMLWRKWLVINKGLRIRYR
jgi:hypothetical protein